MLLSRTERGRLKIRSTTFPFFVGEQLLEVRSKEYKREETGGVELVRRKSEVSKEMMKGHVSRNGNHEQVQLFYKVSKGAWWAIEKNDD